jgi:hypothetical protein
MPIATVTRSLIVAIAPMIALLGASRFGAQPRPPASQQCTTPQYRQFDFFLGDWDVYDVGASAVKARNRVTHMLGACALREVYERPDGYVGESFSTYDAVRGLWHQSWVTNHGELLLLDGGLKSDAMVLTAMEPITSGSPSVLRGTWRRRPDGSLRETAERSKDGGKTWSVVFDIEFRRHR